jgi:PASTA domain
MAVVAAAAFSTFTAAAHADVMAPGTWDGQITGGTLKLGDGDLQDIAVPAGDTFTFSIPAGSVAPVAFKAPATHVPIPLATQEQDGDRWSAAGSLDIAPLTGTVDPATGTVAATGTAHGILHLDFAAAAGWTSSLYCHLGSEPAPSTSPAAPAPFDLSLGGAWSAGPSAATLADPALGVVLDCGLPMGSDPVKVIGTPALPGSALTLTAAFVRRADPTPPPTTNTPPASTTKPPTIVTPPAVQCVVPKLKGLKLKKARQAAKKANCKVGTVKRKRSVKKRTTVLKQSKTVGAILVNGATIRLTVAR